MEAPVCRSRLEINFIRLLDETQQMANGSKPKDWTFEKVGDRAGPLCHVLKLASYHNTTWPTDHDFDRFMFAGQDLFSCPVFDVSFKYSFPVHQGAIHTD